MEKDKVIDVLNSLIVINNDRIDGYQTAIEESEDADLKAAFARFIQTSEKCRADLATEVVALGGKPAHGTRADGKIYRAWMDFKALVTGKDRKAILNSCEYGEDVAVKTYEKAMKDGDLEPGYKTILISQHAKIKADHDTVKQMRDAEVNA